MSMLLGLNTWLNSTLGPPLRHEDVGRLETLVE